MTETERDIVVLLGEVWNLFLELPIQHPMDQQEMCAIIHSAQEKVLARPGLRSMYEQE